MMRSIKTLIAVGLITGIAGQTQAADNTSRYQSWQPPAGETVQPAAKNNNKKMQQMVDELNQLIDDADKARAADRRFIEDLRDVVNQYDWPWRKTLLDEDFTDGTTKRKPAWEIIHGDFVLKRGPGLHSNIVVQSSPKKSSSKQSDEDVAAALFGAFLDKALKTEKKSSNSKSQPATYASIINKTTISNAFAVTLDIDVRSQQGRIEIGVYQKKSTGNGYRMAFFPGPRASIEIQRIGSRGKSIIDVADNIDAKGDRQHHLLWTRDSHGNMNVKLNDKTILQTADRSYKDKFNGVVINNQGGEFSVQYLMIQGD